MRLLCCFFLFAKGLVATQLDLGIQFNHSRVHQDTVSERILVQGSPSAQVSLGSAVRLEQNLRETTRLSMMGEVYWNLVPQIWAIGARINQENAFGESVSSTGLLFSTTLSLPLNRLTLFATVGGYKRNVLLRSAPLLPLFQESYHEQDFALAVGADLRFTENLALFAQLSTFEEIAIYNLNNPFLELTLRFRTQHDFTWGVRTRYQVLLGFGRMDSWSTGVVFSQLL